QRERKYRTRRPTGSSFSLLQSAKALSIMAEADREALVAIYNATGGPDWRQSGRWNTDADLSEWHRIKTNDQGRVVGLVLQYNN
ncbi:unnamed protein product, partial [Ectocarpus sp. 13 AM-2016]